MPDDINRPPILAYRPRCGTHKRGARSASWKLAISTEISTRRGCPSRWSKFLVSGPDVAVDLNAGYSLVVEEHVFRARIAGRGSAPSGAGVPVVHRGVELQSRIRAGPGREEIFSHRSRAFTVLSPLPGLVR